MAKPTTPAASSAAILAVADTNGAQEWFDAPVGTPIQITGRLYAPAADFLRESAQEGESVLAVLKRVIMEAANLPEALVNAAASQTQLQSQSESLASLARSLHDLTIRYNTLAATFNTLADVERDIVAHISAMESAQRDTADATRAVAAESTVIRSAASAALERITPALGDLNHLVDFLNALLDALTTSGEARATKIAVDTLFETRSAPLSSRYPGGEAAAPRDSAPPTR